MGFGSLPPFPPPPEALYSSVEEDGLKGVVGFTVAFGLRLLSVFLFFHLGRKIYVHKVRGLSFKDICILGLKSTC